MAPQDQSPKASLDESNMASNHSPKDLADNGNMDTSDPVKTLTERFTAIESRFKTLDSFLDLTERQNLDVVDDSASEDEMERNLTLTMSFVRDAAFYMNQARHHYGRRYAITRRNRLAAKEAAEKMIPPEAQLETIRQISTAAFLEGNKANVEWVDWDLFILPRGPLEEAPLMCPIEAVVGEPEPHLMLRLESIPKKVKEPTEKGDLGGSRYPNRISSEDDVSKLPLPERLLIRSVALPSVLRKCFDEGRTWGVGRDGSTVVLRPFRSFIHFEKELRGHLNELETRFGKWGVTGKPPPPTESFIPSKAEGSKDNITPEDSPEAVQDRNDVPLSVTTDARIKPAVRESERVPRASKKKENLGSDDNDDEVDSQLSATSITALLHLRCLIKFFDDEIRPKIDHINSDKCRRILFHDLWHLFKPGDVVVGQAEKQAYRVIRVQIPRHKVEAPWLRWYRKDRNDRRRESRDLTHRRIPDESSSDEDEIPVVVHCAYIDFDGKQFGPVSVKFHISAYGGLKDIGALPIYPIRLAKTANLRENLVARGKVLHDIANFKSMYYTGFTLDSRDEIDSQVVVDFSEALLDDTLKDSTPDIGSLHTAIEETTEPYCRSACCMHESIYEDDHIDSTRTEEFIKSLIPETSFRAPSLILAPRPLEEMLPESEDEPTDDEFVVMTYRVFAFVLRSRKWAQLDLTYLRYENTDARNSTLNAFERLELPDGHREMVKSLVTQHFRSKQASITTHDQTDLIKGKGKGLIMLLHGAPGVGKTTTAEGVAELFRKPLFQITCGDLGTTAQDVEQELEKNFALASRWGCILLIDEADVFLSARDRNDFARNGLVAVFLRVLEYYAGILFLTTNRIGDFDEAFASRIQMSLYYPELDEAKTVKIFELNLDLIQERFNKHNRKIVYDKSSIESFARNHYRNYRYNRWNGRQIRNACQTALALAEFDAHGGEITGEVDNEVTVQLQLKYFELVQRAYLDFGTYLGDIRGTKGDRRAIDFGYRAKTNTPYETAPSRFSAAAAAGYGDGRDRRPSYTPSDSFNNNSSNSNYNSQTYYPPQGSQGNSMNSFQFDPLVNQGGGGGGSSNTGYYQNYGRRDNGYLGPQQPPSNNQQSHQGGYYSSPPPQGHNLQPMDSRQHQPSYDRGDSWGANTGPGGRSPGPGPYYNVHSGPVPDHDVGQGQGGRGTEPRQYQSQSQNQNQNNNTPAPGSAHPHVQNTSQYQGQPPPQQQWGYNNPGNSQHEGGGGPFTPPRGVDSGGQSQNQYSGSGGVGGGPPPPQDPGHRM